MSERTTAVLEYIRGYVVERGIAPSIREIGQATGLSSTSTVSYQLDKLARAGHIRRTPGVSRGIVVLA